MRVLIGVDGSNGAFSAVRQAGRLLAASDCVALYCSPPAVRGITTSGSEPQMVERARESFVRAVFEEASRELRAVLRQGIHEIVGTQEPRHGLLVAAEEWRADLLVLGARGRGLVERWLLGSVASSVVRQARVPVLVVRIPPERHAAAPLKVLFACDGTQVSRHAAEVLGRFSWPPDAQGRTIAVVESVLGGDLPQWLKERALIAEDDPLARAWVLEQQATIDAERTRLTDNCRSFPFPFQHASPLVVPGQAADQILKTISAEAIDLVVLGARRRGTVSRWLLGSTSERVLTHAPCSVLIVRQPEHP